MKPTNKGQQECLKKAEAHLDEGKKALGTRQKHIMAADWSDYGWPTVQQYDINPLAMDSEDKKRLEKAEKEAQRLANKGENRATGKKLRCNWSEGSGRREMGVSGGFGPPATVSQARPQVLASCFKCAAWGHLAANCPTKDRAVYLFCQSVVYVSSAELSSGLLSDVITVDNDQDVQTNCMSLYCFK